jgi:hypothetical protein
MKYLQLFSLGQLILRFNVGKCSQEMIDMVMAKCILVITLPSQWFRAPARLYAY